MEPEKQPSRPANIGQGDGLDGASLAGGVGVNLENLDRNGVEFARELAG